MASRYVHPLAVERLNARIAGKKKTPKRNIATLVANAQSVEMKSLQIVITVKAIIARIRRKKMTKYDIAYSLNKQTDIIADTWEEAEAKLKEEIKSQGIPLADDDNPKGYTLEVFDTNEEDK
jgi:hypothetical protein